MGSMQYGMFVEQVANTATAAGTTSLTSTSKQIQNFTGTTTQTVKLPSTTGMIIGQFFEIFNSSTGIVTMQFADGSSFLPQPTISASSSLVAKLVNLTGIATATNGVWVIATGGVNGTAGNKNYISLGNFENNATTGWSLGTIGTLTNGMPTGTPTFGSGASGNLSIATVSSNQLAGLYSLSYASTVATTGGNMLASQAYTIDAEDQAKVLSFKFYYNAFSGTANCNFSGTSSNSFGVAIYDVTNSSWLSSTGNFNLVQGSGVGIAQGTCQTNATTASIRLVFYNVNATSGAATIYLDDFFLGPQSLAFGPPVTDWVQYTPVFTGFGTAATIDGRWRRVGDSVELQVKFTSGTATAVVPQISLPSGLTIDSSKTGSVNKKFGDFQSTSATLSYGVIGDGSTFTTTVSLARFDSPATAITNTLAELGSTKLASLNALVPVTGWSSNTAMSADSDTRVVAARYHNSGTNPDASGATNVINFDTLDYDTHGAVTTGVSWKFTAPVTGKYHVSAMVEDDGSNTWAVNKVEDLYLYKNGSLVTTLSRWTSNQSGATSQPINVGSDTISLVSGDYIDLRIFQNSGGSRTKSAYMVAIERISGPAVVAATESVNARYTTAAGQSIANASTVTIVFGTKVYDSHNDMNASTGVYTAPVTGKYALSTILTFASAVFTQSTSAALELYAIKNGSTDHEFGYFPIMSTQTMRTSVNGTTEIQLNAGDTIAVAVTHTESAARSLLANANLNWVAISRIGN